MDATDDPDEDPVPIPEPPPAPPEVPDVPQQPMSNPAAENPDTENPPRENPATERTFPSTGDSEGTEGPTSPNSADGDGGGTTTTPNEPPATDSEPSPFQNLEPLDSEDAETTGQIQQTRLIVPEAEILIEEEHETMTIPPSVVIRKRIQ